MNGSLWRNEIDDLKVGGRKIDVTDRTLLTVQRLHVVADNEKLADKFLTVKDDDDGGRAARRRDIGARRH